MVAARHPVSTHADIRRRAPNATEILATAQTARLSAGATEERDRGGIVAHYPAVAIDSDDRIARILDDGGEHRPLLLERVLERHEPKRSCEVAPEVVCHLGRGIAGPGSSDGYEARPLNTGRPLERVHGCPLPAVPAAPGRGRLDVSEPNRDIGSDGIVGRGRDGHEVKGGTGCRSRPDCRGGRVTQLAQFRQGVALRGDPRSLDAWPRTQPGLSQGRSFSVHAPKGVPSRRPGALDASGSASIVDRAGHDVKRHDRVGPAGARSGSARPELAVRRSSAAPTSRTLRGPTQSGAAVS
jgi:hypothetical protein